MSFYISKTDRRALIVLISFLGGCAIGPTTKTYWVNPRVSQELQRQRYTLDSTECVALANQMMPEPQRQRAQSGNIMLYTPTGPIYGAYQTQPATQQGGILAGYQQAERVQNRRNYALACMANRGWKTYTQTVGQ